MQPAKDDRITIEPRAGTDEDPLALNTAYEQQLKDAATAIGEHAKTDQDLEAFLNTLKTTDRRMQADLLAYGRRYDLHLIASVVCFINAAEHLPGYLDNLLGEAGVVLAPNAASAERARISGVIRLVIGTLEPGSNASARISRLTKTAVGLVLECERRRIAVHPGNIGQVIDTALAHSRSYLQKLVDAQDAAEVKDDEVGDGDGAALAAPQAAPSTVDTGGKLEVSPIAPSNPAQTAPADDHVGEKSKAASLTVISSPDVSEPDLPPFFGELPNTTGLKPGLIVLIGRVEGDTINVRGPITMPIADELISSLKDLARSAA